MGSVLKFPVRLADSFRNLMAGFGILNRDKMLGQEPVMRHMDVRELESLYRSDWISRKIIDIPAFDACRAWRQWQADREQIEDIERAERELGLQKKVQEAMTKARLYGGSAMVIGIEGHDFRTELDPNSVRKGDLKFVHVVTGGKAPMIAPGPKVRDITSPWFGEPEWYMRSNTPIIPSIGGVEMLPVMEMPNEKDRAVLFIHPSRVIRFIGAEYPDMERAPDPWGDSVLQVVYDVIRDLGMVNSSVATAISELKIDIIKVAGLTEQLATPEGTNQVLSRYSNANAFKSVINALLLEKDTEEWDRKQLSLSGFDHVMQMYMLLCCAAADVPSTRLMGREPAGQNATGESDMRNYYDRLSSDQEVRLRPLLAKLDQVLLRHVFGDYDETIHYQWRPLWLIPDEKKAAIEFQVAQAHKIDVEAGIINPMVLKRARENYLIENGFLYPGIEQAIEEEDDDEFGEMLNEQTLRNMEEPEEPEPGFPPANGGGA